MRLVSIALFALLLPSAATAQNSGIYIQAGPLVDARFAPTFDGGLAVASLTGTVRSNTYEWIDLSGDRRWQPGEEGALVPSTIPSVLGETSAQRFAPGGILTVGVFIAPSVSLRIEGSFQGDQVTTSEMSTQFSSATTREVASLTDILVAAGWHQGESRRTSITYLAGMVFRRRQDETILSFGFPQLVGRTVTSPLTSEESYSSTTYGQGVMAGVDVAIKLSERFAVVPQVRLVAATNQWNLRPAIAMRWRP
jgi:hypothetical protein